jgi:hypothetical protein
LQHLTTSPEEAVFGFRTHKPHDPEQKHPRGLELGQQIDLAEIASGARSSAHNPHLNPVHISI